MPEETFKIRIKPDGTIYFLSSQIGEERIRLLREMLEDCLGSITDIQRAGSGDFPGPATSIVEKKQDEMKHQG